MSWLGVCICICICICILFVFCLACIKRWWRMSWQGGRSRILPPPLRQMARAPHLISNQQEINKQQQKHRPNNGKINKRQTKKHISLNPVTSILLRNFHSVWNIREHDRLCWFHFERIPMDTGGGGRRLAGGTLQRCPLILHSGHSPLLCLFVCPHTII